MAYIGRPLQVANLAVQSGTGDGSDTTPIATLDYATTTNGIAVYLDGVRQLAGTDYNVTSQTTLTFTTAPANGVGVDVYFLGLELSIPTPADATVAKAKITTTLINEHVDTTITAADSILFSDATDSNANKKDTVQGVLDLVPTGSWNYVSTATASSASSVEFTNMASGYDYEYVLDKIVGGTDGAGFYLRFGVAGPTYRTSTYDCVVTEVSTHVSGGEIQARADTNKIDILDTAESALGTGTNEALHLGKLFLNDPASTTNETACMGTVVNFGSDPSTAETRSHHIAGFYKTAEAHTSVQFATTTGTFSGKIFQYRRKRS